MVTCRRAPLYAHLRLYGWEGKLSPPRPAAKLKKGSHLSSSLWDFCVGGRLEGDRMNAFCRRNRAPSRPKESFAASPPEGGGEIAQDGAKRNPGTNVPSVPFRPAGAER